MKEIRSIIQAYDQLKKPEVRAALATVVRVEGSSYRRTGARMLVADNGLWVGGISGGCLEGDALNRARLAIAKSTPSLVSYDTSEGDAHQIGVGLGCNGLIEVAFTPLDYRDPGNAVEVLRRCVLEKRKTHILITVTGIQGELAGAAVGKIFLYEGPQSLAFLQDPSVQNGLAEKIGQHLAQNKSGAEEFAMPGQRQVAIFVEILPPDTQLILMGHQYDMVSMSRLAKEMGWEITIASNPAKISPELAGLADKVCKAAQLDQLTVDSYSAIVLMAHDLKTDKANLIPALRTKAPYIGLLGPRVRSERIFDELEAEGSAVPAREAERIYAPAGLDIGASTPEEIALSILAEIRTVLSQRGGSFLRNRTTTIHERG